MMLPRVQIILALCLFKTIAAAPQQQGVKITSSGPTSRRCGSYEAVSGIKPVRSLSLEISPLIQLGGVAAVYNSKTDFRASTHICGATILSDRYLLTAANCVANTRGSYGITVGRLNINGKEGDEYQIQNIYIQPGYNQAGTEYNDIALLMTDREIKFSNKTWPLCLPDANKVYENYRLMQISGWGEVSQDNRPSELQTAYVNTISHTECDDLWRRNTNLYNEFGASSYPDGITDKIICGAREGVDACKGDSGGPLSDTDSEGLITVVGVIAKRTGCDDYHKPPGFYTRTAAYLEWIYKTTGIPRPQAQPTVPTGEKDPEYCSEIPSSECSHASLAKMCKNLCHKPEVTTQLPVISDFPTREECGVSLHNNIVGGEKAEVGSWPWLVAIGRMKHGKFDQFCGGTLITKQHVISAAHCFKTNDPTVFVRLGEYNIHEDTDEELDLKIVDRRDRGYNTKTREYDIILLKLEKPVPAFKDNIRPACLPFHLTDNNFEGKNLTVVGWGRFDNNRKDTSAVPLQVNVPVVPVQECNQKYSRITIDNRQICAGKGGGDSCKGDSGGPLNYLDPDKGRFYLVGVVSIGPIHCGSELKPGIYTRVTEYLPWIISTIKEMKETDFDERDKFE